MKPWPLVFLALCGIVRAEPLNVLFIAIDDLRPALGCYGDKTAITPNMDRLAKSGTLFNRAYCQQAVCCPSRLSMLTGLRPDTIKVWDLNTHFREALPKTVTLPQHFKNNGYHTRSIGKIFHGGGKPSKDPPSWSEAPLYDNVRDPKMRYATQRNLQGKGHKRAASESAEVPDNAYVDGLVCEAAEKALVDLEANKKPFFLAVGFRKPHLPFSAPKKYWDLYQRGDIPAPVTSGHPEGAPEPAVRSWGELEGYSDIPKNGRLSKAKTQELRHGYYACISYVDALTGRLLKKLDKLNLSERTLILLWGDHGFHLGEQGLWTKANNYELSTRTPLLLSIPGQANPGAKTDALVEFVDLYPTLAQICGLPSPAKSEGISLLPLLEKPDRPWKTAAFSQYPRSFQGNRHRKQGDIMGYAVRTQQHRYVEWRNGKTRKVQARELYDHQTDPNEAKNLANEPDQKENLKSLQQILQSGWRLALPSKSKKPK